MLYWLNKASSSAVVLVWVVKFPSHDAVTWGGPPASPPGNTTVAVHLSLA